MGCSQAVRQRTLTPSSRRFESCHPSHVGTSYARSDFLFHKKSVTRSTVLLFRKRSRSARLLGCKRPRDGSLSLPTFYGCAFGVGHFFLPGRQKKRAMWLSSSFCFPNMPRFYELDFHSRAAVNWFRALRRRGRMQQGAEQEETRSRARPQGRSHATMFLTGTVVGSSPIIKESAEMLKNRNFSI